MNPRIDKDLTDFEQIYPSTERKQKKRKPKYRRSRKDRVERDRRLLRKLKEERKAF